MSRRPVREWLAPLLAYVGVALLWMADVLRSPTTLLHGHSDAYNYLWRIWWLAEGHTAWNAPLLSSPAVFYPLGHQLPSAEMTPLQMLPAVALSKLLGIVMAYNVVVYATFVLAAVAMYAFCRRLGVSRGAAFVGGLMFAFAAYPTVHGHTHLPLMGTWTLPLGLLWVERTVAAPDAGSRLRAAALVGVAAGLAVWSSWYYAVIFGLALLLYGVLRARGLSLAAVASSAAVAVAVAGAMAAPLYLLVRRYADTETMKWSLDTYAGASPLAFLLPSNVQAVLGRYFTLAWNPRSGENGLHLGWVPLALALAALAWLWVSARRDEGAAAHPRESGAALAVLGGVFLLLSLGPFLYLHGEKAFLAEVAVHWPRAIARSSWARTVRTHGLPLPALYLVRAPLMESMREFTRFGVVVLAATAGLAAVGLDALARTFSPPRRRLLVAACAVLVVVEFFPRPVSAPVVPDEASRWIASQPGGGSVLHLPPRVHDDEDMLTTVWTGKPLATGDATFLPEDYMLDSARMKRYPSPRALRIMDERKVRWIVWDAAAGGPPPEVPGRFEVAVRFGDVVVLERPGGPLHTRTGTPYVE